MHSSHAAAPRRHIPAAAPQEDSCPLAWERARVQPHTSPLGTQGQRGAQTVRTRSPRQGPGQDPRRAPAPRGERLPPSAPRAAGARTASGPRGRARGPSGAPAPAPPTTPLRGSAEKTPAELPSPSFSPSPHSRGPVTHRLKASGCPHCRAGRQGGQEEARVPRSRGTSRPLAPGPGPTPRLGSTPHSGPLPVSQRRPSPTLLG